MSTSKRNLRDWWWRVEWSSKSLERKWSIFLIVCVRELLECVELGPNGDLCEGCRLSPTLSFFLSLSFFFSLFLYFFFSLFLFLSLSLFYLSFPLFFHLSFFLSKLGLTPSWNKDTPWRVGTCSETLSDFPHTWTFVWKSSVQCRGLLSSVFQLRRASKCSADADLMFSGIVCPSFFLIVIWNG